PTPVPQVIAEVFVVTISVLILSATVDSYRAEQTRAENALRRGKSLERLAAEIASETEPMALFHTVARSALLLASAHQATITVRRLDTRPFDGEDRAALEGLASHASIALRNARTIEQGRRLESLSRELSGAMPEDVIARIAETMQAVFDLEWVIINEVKGDLVRSLAALGK